MVNNDCLIHYKSLGEGPPVVLIHGMAGSLRQWDYLIPQLVNEGFSAHALDLLGHGESAKPPNPEEYHIEVIYQRMTCWIENLKLESPPILVGHSLGGYLSLIYARRHLEKVQGLVLTDPLYSPQQLSPVARWMRKWVKTGVQLLESVPAWTIDMAFLWGEKFNQPLPAEMRRQLAQDYKRTTPLVLNITKTVSDLTPELSKVTSPALVVWGAHDMTLAPGSFPRIVSALPKAESYTFQDCGHIPHLTQAPTFNRQVLDFASSLS
jgi:pimeloyl-ACP methyl ester carboxylesterase